VVFSRTDEARIGFFGFGGSNIGMAPRGPKIVHKILPKGIIGGSIQEIHGIE
jgi:hypothetical protein